LFILLFQLFTPLLLLFLFFFLFLALLLLVKSLKNLDNHLVQKLSIVRTINILIINRINLDQRFILYFEEIDQRFIFLLEIFKTRLSEEQPQNVETNNRVNIDYLNKNVFTKQPIGDQLNSILVSFFFDLSLRKHLLLESHLQIPK